MHDLQKAPKKCDRNGVLIPGDGEPILVVNWRARAHIRFHNLNVMVHEAYVNIVLEVPPVEVDGGIAGVVE